MSISDTGIDVEAILRDRVRVSIPLFAKISGESEDTVRHRIRTGTFGLPVLRVGQRMFIPTTALRVPARPVSTDAVA